MCVAINLIKIKLIWHKNISLSDKDVKDGKSCHAEKDAYTIIRWLVEILFFDPDVIANTILLVTDRHGGADKKEAASDDENSRYALEDAEENDGKKESRGRNEAKRNAGKCVWRSRTWIRSYLDRGAANRRRAETPLNVAGNPVFRLNAIAELTLLRFCH